MRIKTIFLLGMLVLSVVLGFFASHVVATNDTVPNFPSCTSFTVPGDWSSSASGNHHIPGQEATISGKDDVYYIQNGNFVQCLCPSNGASGIQTNWWNVDGVSQETVNSYTQQGWMQENGQAWNLMNYPYLAKNSNYSCQSENPTPTPTTSVTPSVTMTPAPTATPQPSSPSTPSGNVPAPSCPDTPPTAPTLLSVAKSGNDGVELVWSEPDANVNYYVLSYGFEQNKEMFGVPNTGKTTRYRIGSLDLSKRYFFKVRSQKGCAVSGASNELSYPQAIGGVKGLANTDSWAREVMLVVTAVTGLGIAVLGWKFGSLNK